MTPARLVRSLIPLATASADRFDQAERGKEDDYVTALVWLAGNDCGDLWVAAIGAAARGDLMGARSTLEAARTIGKEYVDTAAETSALALVDQAEREKAAGTEEDEEPGETLIGL